MKGNLDNDLKQITSVDTVVRFSSSLFLFYRQQLQRSTPALCALRLLKTSPATHSEALSTPQLDGAPKEYSPKIQQLVKDIAGLTLLEVSDLNELLKVGGETEFITKHVAVIFLSSVFLFYRKLWTFQMLEWCQWGPWLDPTQLQLRLNHQHDYL